MKKLTDDMLAKILWDYNTLSMDVKKSDCIIVLGSHDLRVAHKGAELFLHGYAPIVIASGNVGKLTEGMWTKPESEVFAEEMIRMGVPKEKIFIENKSTNTGENVMFTKTLLENMNVAIHSAIVVQKPHMERRALATFKKFWPDVELIVTSPDFTYDAYSNAHFSKVALKNLLVGYTQRILLYPEKGFQVSQEMPIEVKEALDELIQRGYTKHLI